jgi:hypothetical protein
VSTGWSRQDWPAVTTLLVCGALIGLPIFAGGHSTYLDNPAHLAEIHSLAQEAGRGWSDLAFCGFPLGTLHAPLATAPLVWWTRLGLDPAPLYALLLWVSFCLPAICLYFVLRRRAGALPSAGLAYLLLIQRPSVVGTASAFGGMWTFHLAAAGLILLCDRLARDERGPSDRIWITLLAAGIALTHLFVAVTMFYLFVVHAVVAASRGGKSRNRLPGDFLSLALAALASGGYWLPSVLARKSMHLFHWDLPFRELFTVFLLPMDVKDALMKTGGVSPQLLFTDAIPLILPILAGLAGLGLALRRSPAAPDRGPAPPDRRPAARDGLPPSGAGRPADATDLARTGGGLALLLLVLLLIAPLIKPAILGLSSWRQLYFVRAGMALASLPLLTRIRFTRPGAGTAPRALALGLAAAALGLWWGLPLRDAVPPARGQEMREVRALWGWLKENRKPDWGRVYLQDTFMAGPPDSRLASSHILALTAYETGVRQVGAYYGVVPYPTAGWTNSLLYSGQGDDAARLQYLLGGMEATNSTHLVLCEPELIETYSRSPLLRPRFRPLFRAGRFAVLERSGATSAWAEPMSGGTQVRTPSYSAGQIGIETESANPGGAVMVRESYHPFWRVEGSPGVECRPMKSGLIQLAGLPAGTAKIRLSWRVPRLPWVVSGVGWLGILVWFLVRRKES